MIVINFFIIGGAGSGKDTVADYLHSEYGYKKVAIADKLRSMLMEVAGSSPPSASKERAFLISLGKAIREVNKYYLCEEVLAAARTKSETWDRPVVISDVRFPHEWRFFAELGYIPIRILAADNTRQERLRDRDRDFNLNFLDDISEKSYTHLPGWHLRNEDLTLIDGLYKQVDNMLTELKEMTEDEYRWFREQMWKKFLR